MTDHNGNLTRRSAVLGNAAGMRGLCLLVGFIEIMAGPGVAGSVSVAVIGAENSSAQWCDFLRPRGYDCTALPTGGPDGTLTGYDVIVHVGTWADPEGLLADFIRTGKGVMLLGSAPRTLGIDTNIEVQEWVGANASSQGDSQLLTIAQDAILGALPAGSVVHDCVDSPCDGLTDTTGHLGAKVLARLRYANGAIGLMRNTWNGGSSVYATGLWPVYSGLEDQEIILRALALLARTPGICQDLDVDGSVDVCCLPSATPNAARLPDSNGNLLAAQNNRYLSFSFTPTFTKQAVRVIFRDLPPPYNLWNGTTMWVGAPRPVSEIGGSSDATPPASMVGSLQCDPAFVQWSGICVSGWNCVGGVKDQQSCSTDADCAPLVHVYHEGVIPGGQYEVQAVFEDCPLGTEANFLPPLLAPNPRWGDVGGRYDPSARVWTAPDGSVDVVTDVVAALGKFANRPNAPNKARVDVEPTLADQKVDIGDVTRILDAFRALPYPFSPRTPSPCP